MIMLMVLIGTDHIKCLMKFIANIKLGSNFSQGLKISFLKQNKSSHSSWAVTESIQKCIQKLLNFIIKDQILIT